MYQNVTYKCNDIAKFADFRWKNADVNTTQEVCHVIYIFFISSFVWYKCAKFHHCRIFMISFMEGGLFCFEKAYPERVWH